MLGSLGVWDSWLLYLIPSRAMLVWIEAAIRPLSWGEWLYAVGYSALTAVALYAIARRSFQKFVIRTQGVH